MSNDDLTLDQFDLESSRQRSALQGPASYELLEQVGQGTFGEVWKARQIRTGQMVALKLLRLERRWDVSQLRQELEKLRQVSQHPGIVTLLDADLQASPAYLAMPYLGGGSLQSLRPSNQQARLWLEELAQALAYSHSHGVFHCDLKPANILLDDQMRPLMVDFGQSLGHDEDRESWGTLGYMPPEQAVGKQRAQDSWDIYALGATFYMLLGGCHPRCSAEALQELSQSGSNVSQRLTHYVDVLRKSYLIPLRELNPAVDEDLESIVLRCLSLDPSRRTRSAQQIVEDLARSRRGLPLWSSQPWKRSYLVRRWWMRHWQTALPTSLILGSLSLAALWGLTVPYASPDPERRPGPVPALQVPSEEPEGARAADLYNHLSELELKFDPSLEGLPAPAQASATQVQAIFDAALWPDGRLAIDSPSIQQIRSEARPGQTLLLQAAQLPLSPLPTARVFPRQLPPLVAALALLEARQQEPLVGWKLAWAVLICGGRFLPRPDHWNRDNWLSPWLLAPLEFLNNYPLDGLPDAELQLWLKQSERLRLSWPTPEQALLSERDTLLHRLRWGLWRDFQMGDLTLYNSAIRRNLEKLYASQLYWLQVRDFQAMENEREQWFSCTPELRASGLAGPLSWLHPVSVYSARLMRLQASGGLYARRQDTDRLILPDHGVGFFTCLLEVHCKMVRLRLRMAGELARRQGRPVKRWSDLPLGEVPDDPVKPMDKLHIYQGTITGASPHQPIDGSSADPSPARRHWLSL